MLSNSGSDEQDSLMAPNGSYYSNLSASSNSFSSPSNPFQSHQQQIDAQVRLQSNQLHNLNPASILTELASTSSSLIHSPAYASLHLRSSLIDPKSLDPNSYFDLSNSLAPPPNIYAHPMIGIQTNGVDLSSQGNNLQSL